jgi:hypothetical protein
MAYKSDGGPKGEQTAKDRKAGDVGAKGGLGGGKGGNDNGGTKRGNPTPTQEKVIADAYASPSRQYDTTMNEKAWRDADTDAQSDGVGGLLSAFGLGELSPYDDPNYTPGQTRANWGLDPIAALASFAGLATGVPASIGWAATKWGLNKLGVKTPTIGLGPNVLSDDPDGVSMRDINGRGIASTASGEKSTPAQQGGNGNGGRGNGLLPTHSIGKPVAKPAPQIPPAPTKPPVQQPQGPSKFPTPSQKFHSASYQGLGSWEFDPETQQVAWRPRTGNGLLPFVAA